MSTERRRLLRLEVAFGVFGAMLVGLAFLFAAVGTPAWLPAAPLAHLGVPSPLSGMTRSFVALASGDVSRAFAWHLLGPLTFAACAALPVLALASWVRGRRFGLLQAVFGSRALWWGVGLLFVGAWARQIAALG